MGCTDGIFRDIVSNCTTNKQGGLEAVAYIINRSDAIITFSNQQNKENVITSIEKATGKKGYTIKAFKKGINAGHTVVTSDTRPDTYQHYVSFEVFETSPEAILNASNLNDVIVIVESKNKTSTGEGVFFAYGVTSGLWKAEDTLDWNTDLASRKIKLQTLSGNEEPYPAYVVFDTDYATTKQMLEALTQS